MMSIIFKVFFQVQPRTVFVLIVLCSSAGFLYWASTAQVDIIVRTQGRVIPAGKSQILQHLEGGIVQDILVQEGQVVAAGQVLMELSDIRARSNRDQDRSKSAAFVGREARLLAESRRADYVVFPVNFEDANIKASEEAAFKSRRAKVVEEVRVLNNQSAQNKGEINEAKSKQLNVSSELKLAEQKFKIINELRQKNAASDIELLDIESSVQQLLSQIAAATSAIPRLQAAVAETQSRIALVWSSYQAEASAELTQVRADLEMSKFEMVSNTDRLERNKVRAPVAGIVNRLAISTVGGVIKPGEVLMEITPSYSGIVIESHAKPNDRANLRTGLTTRVRIGAYDYATYGTLNGKVTDVSADTLMDEHEGRYYRVMVEAVIDDTTQQIEAVPGMIAIADIVVGKRTILSYLLSPIMRFRDGAFRDPR